MDRGDGEGTPPTAARLPFSLPRMIHSGYRSCLTMGKDVILCDVVMLRPWRDVVTEAMAKFGFIAPRPCWQSSSTPI